MCHNYRFGQRSVQCCGDLVVIGASPVIGRLWVLILIRAMYSHLMVEAHFIFMSLFPARLRRVSGMCFANGIIFQSDITKNVPTTLSK